VVPRATSAPRPPVVTRGPRGLELAVPDFVDTSPPFTWPVEGPVTSTFGRRRSAWHRGIDIKAERGAVIFAAAAGVIVTSAVEPRYGRVVKIEHDDGFVTVYAHNEENLVQAGMHVSPGDPVATIGKTGRATAHHLHFEIRTFLIKREVNGATPRYGYRCGPNCAPGPGYWPIDAPDLPSDLGWRNPTHVIAHRAFPPSAGAPLGEVVVATRPVSPSVTLWANTPGGATRQALGELDMHPGERFALLDVRAGPEDSRATSALGYQLWYRIRLPDGRSGWVQAAVPSSFETGADGRPSSISFNFYPAISAAP